MPVLVARLTEPDELATALNPSKVEVIPTGRGPSTVELVSVEFASVRLRRAIGSLPLLLHVERPADQACIAFTPDETSASMLVNGITVDAARVLCYGTMQTADLRSIGPVRWANLVMNRGELDALSYNVAGQDLASNEGRVANPSRSTIRKLRALHAGTITLAIKSPEVLVDPEVTRGIEEQIKETITDCLYDPACLLCKSVQVRHAAVMRRFRDLLDANLDRPLYLPEVCAALGVSHRALSYCCHEFFGMAPKRYFYLRRMHLARRALREAYPGRTTVTEVATRHGF